MRRIGRSRVDTSAAAAVTVMIVIRMPFRTLPRFLPIRTRSSSCSSCSLDGGSCSSFSVFSRRLRLRADSACGALSLRANSSCAVPACAALSLRTDSSDIICVSASRSEAALYASPENSSCESASVAQPCADSLSAAISSQDASSAKLPPAAVTSQTVSLLVSVSASASSQGAPSESPFTAPVSSRGASSKLSRLPGMASHEPSSASSFMKLSGSLPVASLRLIYMSLSFSSLRPASAERSRSFSSSSFLTLAVR